MITFKTFTVSEAKDPKEYGYEGDMAISQLKSVIMNAQELMNMLKPETDLPEWVQSKITLAEDYISTARNYMKSENE
jgi:serine protease inhibitor